MPSNGVKSVSTKIVTRPDGSTIHKTKRDYGWRIVETKVVTRQDGTQITKQVVKYPERSR